MTSICHSFLCPVILAGISIELDPIGEVFIYCEECFSILAEDEKARCTGICKLKIHEGHLYSLVQVKSGNSGWLTMGIQSEVNGKWNLMYQANLWELNPFSLWFCSGSQQTRWWPSTWGKMISRVYWIQMVFSSGNAFKDTSRNSISFVAGQADIENKLSYLST